MSRTCGVRSDQGLIDRGRAKTKEHYVAGLEASQPRLIDPMEEGGFIRKFLGKTGETRRSSRKAGRAHQGETLN